MKKFMKKALSMVLVSLLIVGVIPTYSFAETNENPYNLVFVEDSDTLKIAETNDATYKYTIICNKIENTAQVKITNITTGEVKCGDSISINTNNSFLKTVTASASL